MLGFIPLSSAPISSQGILPSSISSSIAVGVTASGTVTVQRDLSCTIDVIVTVSGNAVLDNNAVASINAAVTTSGNAVLGNNAVASINAVVTTSGNAVLDNNAAASINAVVTVSGNAVLDNNAVVAENITVTTSGNAVLGNNAVASINAVVTVSGNAVLDNNAAANETIVVTTNAAAIIDNPLAGNITATDTTSVVLNVDKLLAADISGTVTSTTATISLTKDLDSSLSVSATIFGDLTQIIALDADIAVSVNAVYVTPFLSTINVTADVSGALDLTKNLSGNLDVSGTIEINTYRSFVNVVVTTNAILDVDGNTIESPGGESTLGFYPPNAVILAAHSESANAATYTITADFSDDPNIITEIVEVDFDDNPVGVLSYSIAGNIASILINTPKEVYKQSSTFILTKEVIPFFNTIIDYNTRFNAVIKQSRLGNNFYSTRFFGEGGYTYSLKDDGYGNINLYEWQDTVNNTFSKRTGTINYDTGEIRIQGLNIQSVENDRLFFYVESIDEVIPTQDYLNTANSLIVQSSTITFPTGETVEISQYEKSTDKVIIWAYVKARSYNVATPTVTIEEREAFYKIYIIPDYDIGKQQLMQLIAEQQI